MATTTTPEPTEVQAEPTLVLSGIDRSFDAVKALSDVSFEIVPGEIHALLGENGAGKSTLMAIASGRVGSGRGDDSVAGFEQPRYTETGQLPRDRHRPPAPGAAGGHDHRREHPARRSCRQAPLRRYREGVDAQPARRSGTRLAPRRPGRHAQPGQQAPPGGDQGACLVPQILILDEPTAPLGREAVDISSPTSPPPPIVGRRSYTSPTGSPRCASWPVASPCSATGR